MPDKSILVLDNADNIKQLSNTDFTAIAETVLEKVVADASVGTLSTTDLGGGQSTLIGTFSDIYRLGGPGSSSSGTTTVNRTLYQNLHSGSVGAITVNPVEWNDTQGEVKQIDDSVLNSFADDIVSYMVNNDGPGTYRMSTSAPTEGGTWAEAITVEDALSTGNNDTPVTKIYVKTSGLVNTDVKILKTDGSGLKAMSDAELEQIAERVKQRIIDTFIGQYRFQETAPSPGTWENMGTIDDNYLGTQVDTFFGPGTFDYFRYIPFTRYNVTYSPTTYTYSNYFYRWVFYTSGIFNGFYGPNNSTYLNFLGTDYGYGSNTNYYVGGTYYGYQNYVGFGTAAYYGTRVNNTELTQETLTLWRRVS